ncbi:MAG TPA: class I SAM-dependent methyltransferase [Pyrinomonadaceae bacterium]|nr:class I SAM-dependent methyltransferase [Pyrinomonadaceae bacterium]
MRNSKLESPLDSAIEDIWGYAKRLRFVREMIRAGAAGGETVSVLDIGCGNGSQLAIPLAEEARLRITGVDPDAASIAHARQLAGARSNLQFVCAPIDNLDHQQPFDVIILSEVLEHLRQPEEMLRQAAALLAREGILIVTVPNGYGEFEIDSWIFRTLRLQRLVDRLAKQSTALAGTDNHESGHLQFFTRPRLRRLFDQAGLQIVASSAGSLLAGPIAGHFVAQSQRLIDWNAGVTDRLPFVLASGWYFALRLNDDGGRAEDKR